MAKVNGRSEIYSEGRNQAYYIYRSTCLVLPAPPTIGLVLVALASPLSLLFLVGAGAAAATAAAATVAAAAAAAAAVSEFVLFVAARRAVRDVKVCRA